MRKVFQRILEIQKAAEMATDFEFGRLPYEHLYLAIQRDEVWQLPWANRRDGDSIETTLQRLVNDQLAIYPFFPGFAPINFQKFPGQDLGSKVFYYRAWITSSKMKKGLGVEKIAWFNRTELS